MLYNYKRVSKDNPCPICGKDHWCRFAKLKSKYSDKIYDVVICNRIKSDKECYDRGGGWIHIMNEGRITTKENFYKEREVNKATKAPIEVLDQVYKILLSKMPEAGDVDVLRGFSKEDLGYLGYKYYDRSKIKHAVREIINKYGTLAGIPGAYTAVSKDNERYWTFGGIGDSIMMPIRALNNDNIFTQGPIQGILLRNIRSDSNNKYYIMSSTKKENGTNSGAPVHVSVPKIIKTVDTIGITEGVKKADIWAKEWGIIVLGMQGTYWKDVPLILNNIRDKTGINKVMIAMDMDKIFESKAEVLHTEEYLKKVIKSNKYNVETAFWDPVIGKGIDDVILNGHSKEIKYKAA